MKSGSLSLTLLAEHVPARGERYRIEANEAERRALAEELGLREIGSLNAELEVRPLPDHSYSVRGALEAELVQTDVVTLEPLPQTIAETIDLIAVSAEREGPTTASGEDRPDVFSEGRIALGACVAEHLALGLDPYPRAAGVEFPGHIEDDSAADSPLAALAALKKKDKT